MNAIQVRLHSRTVAIIITPLPRIDAASTQCPLELFVLRIIKRKPEQKCLDLLRACFAHSLHRTIAVFVALLSSADYPKVKELLERISQSSEEFIRICDKEVAIYMMLRDFSGRSTAKDTLKMETGYPNLFSEDTLIFCRTLLDKTDGVTLDGLNEDIAAANRELACAYEKTYKSLLQLKGQTFEAIDVEMQKRANSLLDFKGKFEDKT